MTVLGTSGVLSMAGHGDMSLDTYCVTYLSTYLVPVANPGRSTGASSSQPTFAGNSSLPVTQIESQSVLTFDTSVITSDATKASSSGEVEPTEAQSGSEIESRGELTSGTTVIASGDATGVSSSAAIEPTQAQSGSETVSFDSTIGTLTDQITTSSGSTVSNDALTTSTGIIEPPGRSVIILISASDTRKRQNTDKGFVGDNNPSICTFAESFNFAEEQLFENGVPLFYNGEDYKELAAGSTPPEGAVTRLFTTAGRSLQVELPGERQCQNGKLVGIDTATSAIGTATSEGIGSESVTSVEGSTTTEITALSSDSIAASSSIAQTQSVRPVSQTTESEVSTAASSSAIESIPLDSTTSIAVSDVSTLSPASSLGFDESTTAEIIPTSAPSLVSTSVQVAESTSTSQASPETTESGTTSSKVALETTTEANTSGTETTVVNETTTEIDTTTEAATESETTTAETSVPSDETSTADVTSVESSTVAITSEESTSEASTTAEETTTLETTAAESTTEESTTEESTSEESTTQEPTTTAETTTDTPTTTTTTTTSAAATTTAALTCADLPNPYTDSNGNIYNLACNTDVDTAQRVDQITTDSFVDCMEACSGRSQCDGVEWESSNSQCTLINEIDGSGQSDGIDIAILQGS
ncbi:hypothetical protein H9Q72_001217 [Fusarium xylarioides]|uniref:Apple domain-containing protein n=1 Tax=Fusarium xylarioides TaxID=221167 RepID=A0A9P7I390_9HYPO|nr:hypothetical protein H9Q72_001217 [Fusarium xylarioides]